MVGRDRRTRRGGQPGRAPPLEGENRIEGATRGSSSRTLKTARLDTLLASQQLSRIELLKIDVERTGDLVLRGAANTLSITQNILVKAGFRLRRLSNRNLWFQKK